MTRYLDVLSRRRLLEISGSGFLGLNLGGLWRAELAAAPATRVKSPIRSCILVFLYGGPSHLDTFDLKPNAPSEVRGEFKSIATSAPGVRVCEHLPRLSKLMNKFAVVRSVTHAARLHDSAAIHALTGRRLEGPDRELFEPLPQVYPSYGSAVAYMHREFVESRDTPFVSLPFSFRNVHPVPCQGGGFLGSAYDPLRIEGDSGGRKYAVEVLTPTPGIDVDRTAGRRGLLAAIEKSPAESTERKFYDKAYRLLESESLRMALDISREPARVRERYGFGSAPIAVGEGGGGGNGAEMGLGRELRGQNFLLARRLVEAGIPFVNIYDFKQQGQNWDAHFKCANQHKQHLLPAFDRGLSALIEDLEVRGLLDSTLVVVTGEFGRTPKHNGEAGRDHWPDCYSVLLAGGGVRGGSVYGASDRIGAYPASDPVTPGDIAATIYERFGIDPAAEINDQSNRAHRLASGEPLSRLF